MSVRVSRSTHIELELSARMQVPDERGDRIDRRLRLGRRRAIRAVEVDPPRIRSVVAAEDAWAVGAQIGGTVLGLGLGSGCG